MNHHKGICILGRGKVDPIGLQIAKEDPKILIRVQIDPNRLEVGGFIQHPTCMACPPWANQCPRDNLSMFGHTDKHQRGKS